MKGSLYVFEGMDCAGKDTLADAFTAHLRNDRGRDVLRINLPDRKGDVGALVGHFLGRPLSEDRDISDGIGAMAGLNDLFLGALYQCEHMLTGSQVIRTRLDAGADVVVVRYSVSTFVYQRKVRALHPLIAAASRFMPRPRATFFADVLPSVVVSRKCNRAGSVEAGSEYYDRTYDAMLDLRAAYLRVLAPVRAGKIFVFGCLQDAEPILGEFIPLDGNLPMDEAKREVIALAQKRGVL